MAIKISPVLILMYQASLTQGAGANYWKQALVTTILKIGKRTDPANYRPISLTSVCCKTMEHIIHSQAMKHLDNTTSLQTNSMASGKEDPVNHN